MHHEHRLHAKWSMKKSKIKVGYLIYLHQTQIMTAKGTETKIVTNKVSSKEFAIKNKSNKSQINHVKVEIFLMEAQHVFNPSKHYSG